jgi:hypothetical protein
MKLAVNTSAAPVFIGAVSAGVSSDLGFTVNPLSGSIEIGRQGRVAAVGEHASDLPGQDAL